MKSSPNEAIILAGGFGTRLKSVVQDIPKPMAPVNGHPFLEYVLDALLPYNIERVILSIGYRGEVIQEHFGEAYKKMRILYSVEDEPLGTGGGIKKATELCECESVFVLNGDTFFDVDLNQLHHFFIKNEADLALSLKFMEEFDRYGTVELDKGGRVIAFNEKQYCSKGLINGGVYLMKTSIFEPYKLPERFSFEKDLMERYFSQSKIYGKDLDAYFIDIGIPEDYQKAQEELGNN